VASYQQSNFFFYVCNIVRFEYFSKINKPFKLESHAFTSVDIVLLRLLWATMCI